MPIAAVEQDFSAFVGDSAGKTLVVVDEAGAAVDISAASAIAFTVTPLTSSTAVLTKTKAAGGITFTTDGKDGAIIIAISSADTAALAGRYFYRVTVTLASGPYTAFVGLLSVDQNVLWTYDPARISTVPLYMVRRLIGDVKRNDQQLFDAEVTAALVTYPNVYLAAAECCRWISAEFSRKVDQVQGEIRLTYSSQATAYRKRAEELQQLGLSRSAGAVPFAGGISNAQKGETAAEADRVDPQFNLGMFENLRPIAPAPNQTPGDPAGGTGG